MRSTHADVAIAGAGMAGLVAAAEARAHGASPRLHEKTARPGGSMLLSSGVIWRHRRFEDFRAECPAGDPVLQRLVFDRLDEDLRWLESLGAPLLERTTGNPLTSGARFDPAGLTAALARAAGAIELETPVREQAPGDTPLILAGGGFAASRSLVAEHITGEAHELLLRAAPGCEGDGLRLGLAAGAEPSAGLDQFYGRNMPAPPARVGERDFVALAQLYAHHARVTNLRGERFETGTWSEIDVVQWTARQPRARARYSVEAGAMERTVRDRTVCDMVEAARRAGAPVTSEGGSHTVEVVAGITTTLGGLRVDERGRAAERLFACGADAGGVATGGYASGLAAALVLGRIAARSALGL
jgi:succinate dehydrogenase/fumarate reductase flavoprotein subunit